MAVLVISGCTTPGILCEEDYIKGFTLPTITTTDIDSECKSHCYSQYGVTSFKTEQEVKGTLQFVNCYCDINNCNPRKDVE